jgi:hypothetical protein
MLLIKSSYWVKAHYNDQIFLLQILFFETIQLSISTKLISKEVFINYIPNKVIQLLNNTIVKWNYIFYIIIKWSKVYICKIIGHVPICKM